MRWTDELLDDFKSWHRVLTTGVSPFCKPAGLVDIVDSPGAARELASQLAGAVFGDASLVFDATARMLAGDGHGHGLLGAPPAYEAPAGETLAQFITSRERGVLALDDFQALDVVALATLADIADRGRACRDGSCAPELPALSFIILAFARIALPSPAELARCAGRSTPWAPGREPPPEFWATIQKLGAARHPEQFGSWVMGRFTLRGRLAWARYLEWVESGRSDTPLFEAPLQVPVPAARTGLPDAAQHLCEDVDLIFQLPPEHGRFDVFISYSWARTSEDAQWLCGRLRAAGYRVFFDKDEVAPARVPPNEVKQYLIQQLSRAVRSSRACIVFEAALRAYAPTPGFDLATAVRRGLAMWTANEQLVEYSWQTLELSHMSTFLAVYEATTARVEHGVQRDLLAYRDRSELETVARKFLSDLDVRPSESK